MWCRHSTVSVGKCARSALADIGFQNIVAARRRVEENFKFDFAADMAPDAWGAICRAFEKRHLLAHKMGVIDNDYDRIANDQGAIVGRRVCVKSDEVADAIRLVEKLGQRLFEGVART
jgi:hypothetical protein